MSADSLGEESNRSGKTELKKLVRPDVTLHVQDALTIDFELIIHRFMSGPEFKTTIVAKAEDLAKKAKPTNDDAQILRTQLPNNEVVLGHFFGKLDDSDRLPPLLHEGFFEEPPAPVEDPENGRVRYCVWHQSRFLTRLAPLVPDQVLELTLKTPETTNFLIHQYFAEVSLKLRPALAAKLLPKINQWLDGWRSVGT